MDLRPRPIGGLRMVQCRGLATVDAPVCGGDNGGRVAVARHRGGLIPGTVMPNTGVCHISWGGQVITKNEYFLLNNPGGAELMWQQARGGVVPVGALQGGYTEDGVKEPLYIGRIRQGGGYVCGKVHPSHRVCYAPYWGKEISSATYEVLCLKSVPLATLGL